MLVNRIVTFMPETEEEFNILQIIQNITWKSDPSRTYGIFISSIGDEDIIVKKFKKIREIINE